MQPIVKKQDIQIYLILNNISNTFVFHQTAFLQRDMFNTESTQSHPNHTNLNYRKAVVVGTSILLH